MSSTCTIRYSIWSRTLCAPPTPARWRNRRKRRGSSQYPWGWVRTSSTIFFCSSRRCRSTTRCTRGAKPRAMRRIRGRKKRTDARGAMETVTLYGFQRSTYVNVARLVLHAKGVRFTFHDTENEMYTAEHLERHPFGRVPVLQHGNFRLYETSAIALYVDDAFDGPRLQP